MFLDIFLVAHQNRETNCSRLAEIASYSFSIFGFQIGRSSAKPIKTLSPSFFLLPLIVHRRVISPLPLLYSSPLDLEPLRG
ncbi:unnamed protein product [Citrullus colocynthis]|uniref:Uncharacterized protein n=1 Tax=Citrullus colocynthis TaxID=252529 RepID=A0ABP0YAN8_9ROSI